MTTTNRAQGGLIRPYFEALRPKTLTASLVPVLMGTMMAPIPLNETNIPLMLSVLFAALFIQIGTNLVNDAFDFMKGADTEERLGPKRLIQNGFLGPKGSLILGVSFFALSVIAAIPFLYVGGAPFMWLLLISILSGWAYTAGPYPLAYRGLGDIFVILFFGPVLTGAAYYFQTETLTMGVLIAGLQIGLLATSLLAINNLRDVDQDKVADKRTLVVRFGQRFGKAEIAAVVGLPYLLNIYWQPQSFLMFLLPLFTLPMAYNLLRGIYSNLPSKLYNRFLQDAALLHLSFGSLLAIGAKL